MTDKQDDNNVFKSTMKSVKPLQHKPKAATHKTKPKPKPLSHKHLDEAQQTTLSDPNTDYSDLTSDSVLSFQRNPLPVRQWREFTKGKLGVEAWLDLHHQTVAQARTALQQFVHEQQQLGQRRVGIIHGKGHRSTDSDVPRLKAHVDHWLRELPQVVAFCSAQPKDGGTGAVYVWLKK